MSSVGAKQATLTARDRSGRTIARTTVKGRQTVLVPVDLVAGENEYFINVTSRNKSVSGDARILNLRLFSAAALR